MRILTNVQQSPAYAMLTQNASIPWDHMNVIATGTCLAVLPLYIAVNDSFVFHLDSIIVVDMLVMGLHARQTKDYLLATKLG